MREATGVEYFVIQGAGHSRHLAVYQKQQLIAAVRLHLVRTDRDTSLCLEAFPEIRDQSDLISGGLIEYTRLIAGSTSLLSSIYSKFLLFEHAFRMAMKDGYRFAIAPVKSKHVGFYKKALNFEESGLPPRPFPPMQIDHHLLILDFCRNKDTAEKRFELIGSE